MVIDYQRQQTIAHAVAVVECNHLIVARDVFVQVERSTSSCDLQVNIAGSSNCVVNSYERTGCRSDNTIGYVLCRCWFTSCGIQYELREFNLIGCTFVNAGDW
ncbi:hypothetical protein D3C71_1023790 [compost metagenome]